LRASNITQRARPFRILSRPQLGKLLEAGFCGVVLLQLRRRTAIQHDCIGKVGIRSQRLGFLIVRTRKTFVFVSLQSFADEHGQMQFVRFAERKRVERD
jgi:hypothetical protein